MELALKMTKKSVIGDTWRMSINTMSSPFMSVARSTMSLASSTGSSGIPPLCFPLVYRMIVAWLATYASLSMNLRLLVLFQWRMEQWRILRALRAEFAAE